MPKSGINLYHYNGDKNSMKHSIISKTVIRLSAMLAIAVGSTSVFAEAPPITEEEFETAKSLYFQRCAGCHGVLRTGATGKALLPEGEGGTLEKGTERLQKIITFGTEGGMNNFDDILDESQLNLLARYIQHEPPVPPEMSLALMKERRKIYVEEADYPTEPVHGRNWENFFPRNRA